jgi:hypothetical protein
VAAAGWAAAGLRAVSAAEAPRRRRLAYVACGVAAVSAIIYFADIPRRVALWAVRDEFEALLAAAPRGEYGGERLARWVGCFYVDEYGADEEGGVFFRTASHADGIGPDTMSYGFAYRPHRESCPFGRSSYRTMWLFGNWYWFSVSND